VKTKIREILLDLERTPEDLLSLSSRHMSYSFGCPCSKSREAFREWVLPRVLELGYTAWDLEAFGQDCGWNGSPFLLDEVRRFLLRCELYAAFFQMYLPVNTDGKWKPARISEGAVRDEIAEKLDELRRHFPTPRDAVAYIMDTFPIVRRKDEERHGEYRTKRVILEIYDEMAETMRTGIPYKTRLNPRPAPRLTNKATSSPSPTGNPASPNRETGPYTFIRQRDVHNDGIRHLCFSTGPG
jgi:hypothetical protein